MNVIPLSDVPRGCLRQFGSDDAAILKTLRDTADRESGYFLLRHHHLKMASATFVIANDLELTGRWILGRIRQHKTQPGRFEILIRRARTCYYLAVDSKEAVAEEIGYLQQDADLELASATELHSSWIVTHDDEFERLGFSSKNSNTGT